MLNLGGGELILIALAALLFIPPQKLPGAARSVGRFLSQLRNTFEEVKKEIVNPSDEDTKRK